MKLVCCYFTITKNYIDCTEAEFSDEIQTKVLRVFLLAIHQSPLQLCLEISITSNSRNLLQFLVQLLYTVKEKGGKPDRKPPSLWFKKSKKKQNSQDYAQKPQQNCTFMISAYGVRLYSTRCTEQARKKHSSQNLLLVIAW